jgi:hypothetical protein
MPTNIALDVQAPAAFARIASERMPIAADFHIVCLWSMLGLLMTAAAFALGFGPELGQALAMAG